MEAEKRPRILVFIPAYRCEPQIGRVLEQFEPQVQALFDAVLVVDNQSPDGTLRAAIEAGRRRFTQCRFLVWRNQANFGLGGSHKAALRYAIDEGFDYLVVLHGDDQGDIRDLVPLLERGEHLRCDALLGARFMRGSRLRGYSVLRTWGNRIYNLLFSLAAGRRIHDLGSGLNLYRLAALREGYYHGFPDDLTFNYVMLLASVARGQRLRFFPISWREDDQVSNVRLFRQAWRVLRLLAGYAVDRRAFLARDLRAAPHAAYGGHIEYAQDARAGAA